jgi:hypothetical protein
VEVEVDRDSDGTLGVAFAGPPDDDPIRDGVYVANLQPSCPAAMEGLLLPGMRILSINGRNVVRSTKATVSAPLTWYCLLPDKRVSYCNIVIGAIYPPNSWQLEWNFNNGW